MATALLPRTPRHYLYASVAGLIVSFTASALMLLNPSTAGAPLAPPALQADPYGVYLASAPTGAKTLTREDAQIRATLGCGHTFAAGTVDKALADAYRPAVCEVLK
jgi:hypothetical protein